jgi:hypothetical protein
MNTDTPETDAMVSADQHHLEDDNFFSASVYWRMCGLARHIERELTTVTAQRDRLAEALEQLMTYQPRSTVIAMNEHHVWRDAKEALQSLTPKP